MLKTLIRSYTVGKEGDLFVHTFKDGKRVDLSPHYSDIKRDRRLMREDAHLEIFRYENGELGWVGSANGHDVEAATSYRLLLQVFLEDASGAGGDARSL